MAERNSFCETIFLKGLFLSYFGLFGWESERNSFCKCGMILTIEEDRIVRAFYLSWNIRNALKRSSILMKFSKIYILWSIIFRAGTTVCFFVFPFFFFIFLDSFPPTITMEITLENTKNCMHNSTRIFLFLIKYWWNIV